MSMAERRRVDVELPVPLANLRAAATSDAFRDSVWHTLGASVSESVELLAYAKNTFDWGQLARGGSLPWPDAPGVSDWERYAEEAASLGVFAALRHRLVQLQFPIEEGISTADDYLRATRRGIPPTDRGAGLRLRRPEELRLFLHPTAAGRVPVIVAGDREDFVALVRALTCRNEPKPVIDAMGACSVTGYNNWDRVRAAYAHQAWMLGEGQSFGHFVGTISAKKELYQDRFLLLSRGPYSNVASSELGLSRESISRRRR